MGKQDQFDGSGEAMGYISLDQAILLARQRSREDGESYRQRLGWEEIVWSELHSEHREDTYRVVLQFRQPARGVREEQTGEEEFVFDLTGKLEFRQVLSWPEGTVSAPAPQPEEVAPIPVAAPPPVGGPDVDLGTPSIPTPIGEREVFCPGCGARTDPGAPFCPSCGAETGVAPAHATGLALVVQADVEYMGFWIRVLAALIDGVLTGIAASIVGAITGVAPLGSLVSILYYVLLTGLTGQTLGKMALGIKVVDAKGEVPGIGRAVLREVVGKFVSAIALLLGYLWVAWHPQKRGWHDFIGGTYVIRKERRPA